MMAHFLIITWHGGGNVPPAIGIAQELKTRGHRVTVAGYESQRKHIHEQGFPFVLVDPQSQNWMDLPPDQRFFGMANGVWACENHVHTVPELVAREQPHAVIVDCMMYAALAALETLDLPHAVLVHSPAGLTEPGVGFDAMMMPAINAVRAKGGRPAIQSSWEAWSNGPAIIVTLPELDPLSARVPSSFHYVGPVFERVPPSGWNSPWPLDDPRPLVLVSFSTHAAWDQTSRILRSIEALSGGGYRVLITAGMTDVQGIALPENIFVTPYLPHNEVLPVVKVIITHGGHGTILSSLAYGVPMVCLPNILSDQPGLAAQVQSLGAGLMLDGDNATSSEIAQAVERVLHEPSYAAAAHRLAAEISTMQGAKKASTLLEQL